MLERFTGHLVETWNATKKKVKHARGSYCNVATNVLMNLAGEIKTTFILMLCNAFTASLVNA